MRSRPDLLTRAAGLRHNPPGVPIDDLGVNMSARQNVAANLPEAFYRNDCDGFRVHVTRDAGFWETRSRRRVNGDSVVDRRIELTSMLTRSARCRAERAAAR